MKVLLGALFGVLFGGASVSAQDIDTRINDAVQPITNFIELVVFFPIPVPGGSVPVVLLWLLGAAIFFTFYFRFISVRGFSHALRLVRGDYDDPENAGEVSHFQALATALSGTVGLGNIAGVAIAVSLGGPGATFWMILAGILGMSLKFTECTLGVRYRDEHADGSVSGGPMYYLEKGFKERNMGGLGKVLAIYFAIMCIGGAFGGGNMFQVNQAFQQVVTVTGGADSPLAGVGWIFGLVVAVIVGFVIIGGIKSIARVTEKVVPIMGIIYVSAALVILMMNYTELPAAIGSIFSGAFTTEGIYGGFIGALIQGIRRAAFSNEAGVGSAAIAHAAVRTNEPVTEGLVSLLEPFIDTVVICTMTALVIIITGSLGDASSNGVTLTSDAFAKTISWFPIVLAVAVVLFAFSTMISWSYYGLKAWTYLFGEGEMKELVFKLMFCVFIVIGAAMNLDAVVGFSDAMIFAMSFANIIGLYVLAPTVKAELTSYWQRLQAGEIKKYEHVA